MCLALGRAAVRTEVVHAYEEMIVAQSTIMKGEIKELVEFRILRP